ncbi:hypothetical protein [Nonomuraea jabiensis]|uniref:hypothetical protein n=1 Tax=Nonomuraea jabiensis TaxID=882448 RepID=UPI003D735583
MDWHEQLRNRLSDPVNHMPYQMAVAIEGHPLSPGRQVYALADILGVEPGDLMTDLRKQYADEQQVNEALAQLVATAEKTCLPHTAPNE